MKSDDGMKTVCRKKKRKTSFEMDGQCGSRPLHSFCTIS